jgi:hypothetical protein
LTNFIYTFIWHCGIKIPIRNGDKMQSVLKISEAASIALHAMTYVAFHSDEPATTKDIANNFECQ